MMKTIPDYDSALEPKFVNALKKEMHGAQRTTRGLLGRHKENSRVGVAAKGTPARARFVVRHSHGSSAFRLQNAGGFQLCGAARVLVVVEWTLVDQPDFHS